MSILSKNYLYFEVILSRYTEKQSNYKILKFRVYLKTLKWCVFDIKYFNLTIHFYLGVQRKSVQHMSVQRKSTSDHMNFKEIEKSERHPISVS